MTNKKHRGNGEGTVFQRKDGRWQASFKPENSKRQYVYGKTQAKALEKLRTLQQEEKQGILATGPKQKLGAYLLQWLENVHKPTVRLSSYIQHKSTIHHHLIPALGDVVIQKLTPQHIQSLYTQKIKEGQKSGSIAVMHAVLHGALENAVRWDLVSRNVASLVSPPRVEPHEVHPLSFDEVHRLMDVAKGDWLEHIIILAVTTGMRRGEILALRWSDIDFKNKVLHVRRTMNRYSNNGIVENDPKTKAGRRKVMLTDVAMSALSTHKQQQNEIMLQSGDAWQKRNLVFCDKNGGYIIPDRVPRRFYSLLAKADLPRVHFHDLRHSAATILLTMGIHPKIVQEMLGHSTIAMTMDTYSHLLPSVQQDAVDRMNNAFNIADKSQTDKKEEEGKQLEND